MSLTPERVADIMNSSYAHEIPHVKALCEDWLALRKRAEDAEAKWAGVEAGVARCVAEGGGVV